jgi:hypothetical protein
VPGRPGVAPALHRDIENHAVLIDCAPEIVLDAVDPDEHLIQMPAVAGPGPASPQSAGEGPGKLSTPPPDRFGGDNHTALSQHQLDVPKAETERVVQPNRMADDFGRKTMTTVGIRDASHPATMPCPITRRRPS